MLSCFLRLDIPEASSVVRESAGGGPGVGLGVISREGGCKNEDCDKFGIFIIRASPSTVIVVGSETGSIGGWIGDAGMSGAWDLFGLLT